MTGDRVFAHFARWLLFSFVVAIPSLIWALIGHYDPSGIALGMLGVAVLLALATSGDWWRLLKQRTFVAGSLRFVLAVRILFAVIFPLGMAADLPLGAISTTLADSLWGPLNESGDPAQGEFDRAFLTTAVQGGLLNIELAVLALLAYGGQRLFRKPPVPAGVCPRCRYDLRTTVDRCPECGRPVPPGHRPTVGPVPGVADARADAPANVRHE